MRARHRSFLLALIASVVVHFGVGAGLPNYVERILTTPEMRYEATLVPLAPSPPLMSAGARTKPGVRKPTRRAPDPATFTPPANALAVDAPTVEPDEAVVDAAAAPDERTESAKAAPIAPEPEPPPAAASIAAAETTAPQIVKPSGPAWPERLSIHYRLSSNIADGTTTYDWRRVGNRYEIDSSLQASGFFANAFLGVIRQISSGEIGESGLRPSSFSMQRGETEAEVADFQRDKNILVLRRGDGVRNVPLNAATQDMQSFLFQMAYVAPAMSADGQIDVMVTNARKVYRYQFKHLGEETLRLAFGEVRTIRLLSEAVNPEDAYEMWLAPDYFYLPVRLKFYLSRFPIEQVAVRIGSSAPPKAP